MGIENAKLVRVEVRNFSKEEVIDLLVERCEGAINIVSEALDRDIEFDVPVIIDDLFEFVEGRFSFSVPYDNLVADAIKEEFSEDNAALVDIQVDSDMDLDYHDWVITFKGKRHE
jgi:hypothetical protein